LLGMSTFAEFGSASFELMASEVSLLPDSLEFGKSCRDGAAIGWFKVWNSRVEVALPSGGYESMDKTCRDGALLVGWPLPT